MCYVYQTVWYLSQNSENGVSEETIEANLVRPCSLWSSQLLASLRESNNSNENILFRCNMVTSLYYKVLEHILKEEHRKKPQLNLKVRHIIVVYLFHFKITCLLAIYSVRFLSTLSLLTLRELSLATVNSIHKRRGIVDTNRRKRIWIIAPNKNRT